MKRSIIILMAAASLAALSCTKEVNDQTAPEREQVTMSFDATIGAPTKVELGDANGEGGYKVLWSVGDKITVAADDASITSGYINGDEFTTDITEANAAANFAGETSTADAYYALYPYNSNHRWYYNDDKFSAVFNVAQTANGLKNGLLVAKAENGKLQFKHVTGYIKFEIPLDYTDLVKITFAGKGGTEVIGGKYVNVSPEESTMHDVTSANEAKELTLLPSGNTFTAGTYYIAALPAELSSGIVMTFTNSEGDVATKESSNPAEIIAGDILNLGSITGLSFEQVVTETYTKIDKIADLTAGTYYMAGYLESYTSSGTTTDWSANPYHVCTGVSTDLYTSPYSFNNGVLALKAGETYSAIDVVLEAVADKSNTYYVKINGKYLHSSEFSNRKLGTTDIATEWVATDNTKGGITLTTTLEDGTVSIGTAGAASKLIRSYKAESSLKYGLVFFKKN